MKALLKSHLRQRPKRTSTQTRCVWQWTPLERVLAQSLQKLPMLAREWLVACKTSCVEVEACPER
jgi:DNA-binding HxlR family transcriptional regulator